MEVPGPFLEAGRRLGNHGEQPGILPRMQEPEILGEHLFARGVDHPGNGLVGHDALTLERIGGNADGRSLDHFLL